VNISTEELRALAVVAGHKTYYEEGNGVYLDYGEMDKPWRPHECIAQAMEIVAGLEGFSYFIDNDNLGPNDEPVRCVLVGVDSDSEPVNVTGWADTPQLAIVLAALKCIALGVKS